MIALVRRIPAPLLLATTLAGLLSCAHTGVPGEPRGPTGARRHTEHRGALEGEGSFAAPALRLPPAGLTRRASSAALGEIAQVEVRGPVSLLVGGDVTLGYHYEEYFDEMVRRGRSREEMFAYGFAGIRRAVRDDDLFLVNLECPFTDRGERIAKNFNFRARPELVGSLVAGGVDVVSLANNHLMDYGPVGLADTIETLDEAGIPHFGAGRNLEEARRPAIIERDGVRIAFLGYFYLHDHSIEPTIVYATDDRPGVAGLVEDLEGMKRMVTEDIRRAAAEADLVIPYFHWGREGTHEVQGYVRELAATAVEAGAAAVLGAHPHVLQAMTIDQGVPVAYSLGNFVFGGNWNPRVKESALLRLRLAPGGYQGGEIIPLKTDRFPKRPIQPYLLEGDEAHVVREKLAGWSAAIGEPLPALLPYLPAAEPPPGPGPEAVAPDPQRSP